MDSENRSRHSDAGVLKRHIAGWFLFDFANSILIINGSLYFPQWLVIDNGVSDLWFNLAFTVSSAALLLTGPFLGFLADGHRGQGWFLRSSSLIMLSGGVLISLSAAVIPEGRARILVALASIFLINYGYQLSLVFYNSMLASIADQKMQARISGYGLAFGWIGGLVGIAFILPFVQGQIPFFQPAGRAQAFLPSVLLYGSLTFISLFMLRGVEQSLRRIEKPRDKAVDVLREFLGELRKLIRHREVWLFLFAYFLFSDAILTIQNNATIYFDAVMGFSDDIKAMLFAVLLLMFAVGGIASGYLAGRWGLRKTLISVLGGWVVVVGGLAATTATTPFMILFAFLGILFGAVWNVARVTFLRLIPGEKRGQYFGIYSSYERLGSILGPLIWSAPVVFLARMGSARYRVSLLVMGLMIAASIWFVAKLKTPEETGGNNDVA
ncbi:MFS transporter [Candidatus Bipolaricaulota bacterium]